MIAQEWSWKASRQINVFQEYRPCDTTCPSSFHPEVPTKKPPQLLLLGENPFANALDARRHKQGLPIRRCEIPRHAAPPQSLNGENPIAMRGETMVSVASYKPPPHMWTTRVGEDRNRKAVGEASDRAIAVAAYLRTWRTWWITLLCSSPTTRCPYS